MREIENNLQTQYVCGNTGTSAVTQRATDPNQSTTKSRSNFVTLCSRFQTV